MLGGWLHLLLPVPGFLHGRSAVLLLGLRIILHSWGHTLFKVSLTVPAMMLFDGLSSPGTFCSVNMFMVPFFATSLFNLAQSSAAGGLLAGVVTCRVISLPGGNRMPAVRRLLPAHAAAAGLIGLIQLLHQMLTFPLQQRLLLVWCIILNSLMAMLGIAVLSCMWGGMSGCHLDTCKTWN